MPDAPTQVRSDVDRLDEPSSADRLLASGEPRRDRASPKRDRRILALAVAIVVVLVSTAVVLSVGARESDRGASRVTASNTTVLPVGPLATRVPAEIAWTGTEVLVWAYRRRDAVPSVALFEPQTNQWRLGADMPGPGQRTSAVWAGTSLIVWSSTRAWSYDPAKDAWRRLPNPPIDTLPPGNQDPARAWTGTDVVILTRSADPARRAVGGIAYNVASNRWRTLPPAPIALRQCTAPDRAASNGTDVYTWGESEGPNSRRQLLAFNPSQHAWTILTDLRADVDPASAATEVCMGAGAVAAGRLVATDVLGRAYAFDIAANRWDDIASVLTRPSLFITNPIAVDGNIVTEADQRLQILGVAHTEWAAGPTTGPLRGGVGAVLAADGRTIYGAAVNRFERYRIP